MERRSDLAPWCPSLPLLRRLAGEQGLAHDIEEAVRLARDGAPDDPATDPAARLAELARTLGVPGPGPRSAHRVPGLPPGRPVVEVYGCPLPVGGCTRTWVRAPGVPTPMCHILPGPLDPADDPGGEPR